MSNSKGLADTQPSSPWTGGVYVAPAGRSHAEAEVDRVLRKKAAQRFLLWVDAVGGFLVCLRDEILLGQAVPQAGVDVPILGDLSRRHAKIRREGESYVIEPIGRVEIGGRKIRGEALLGDGDEIHLGDSVRLRFRRPHALSATARLDLVSRHPAQPAADAILLMAQSCILGPRPQSHVICRQWTHEVALFRQDGQIYCKAAQPIEIDGKLCTGRGTMITNSRVAGSDFALSLEEL